MEGDHPVESGKKHVIISFALGFLSCAVIVYVWQALRKEESTMRDDILNGCLKVKLAGKLKEDKKASEELAELLSERRECTRAVTAMEEDARFGDIAFSRWEKMYIETYLETAERLAQFAVEHPGTKSALTAKLLYTNVIPYTTGYGALTAKHRRRSANCDLFHKEILSQHPKTWQATVVMLTVPGLATGTIKEGYIEEIRRLREYLKKDLVEPKKDDPDYEAYRQWFGWRWDGPLRARMIHALASMQTKLGTLDGTRDPYWLNEAKKTYQELVKQYPEYNERNGWAKSHISRIDEMLVEAKTQK